MSSPLRQVRQQTAHNVLHRQSAEGCRGTGRAEHEPALWASGERGTESRSDVPLIG